MRGKKNKDTIFCFITYGLIDSGLILIGLAGGCNIILYSHLPPTVVDNC